MTGISEIDSVIAETERDQLVAIMCWTLLDVLN
jgi:hypothetical protein